jgi:hypothetical protein
MKATLCRAFVILLMGMGAVSCMDKVSVEQNINVPVYMDYATLRASVRSSEGRALVRPGKICFNYNYLLIVEYLEGIHIVDVSNPAEPRNRSFIEIPGCTDVAMRGSVLYTGSYVDLVVIDLSNLDAPKEIGRIEGKLAYTLPAPEEENLQCAAVDEAKGIVVGWEVKRERRELEHVWYPVYPVYYYDSYAFAAEGGATGVNLPVTIGLGGSMARFGLYDDYLYVVDEYSMNLFQVADAAAPVWSDRQWVSGTVETLFIYAGQMFLGTTSGMMVYSLAVPSVPRYQGSFWHATSCDPVVVQGEYAYITLRGGTTCNNSDVNRLDIVKCLNGYSKFELVASHDLTEPYGLGIDGNTLFICDGRDGLKVYDVTDKQHIGQHLLASFPNIQAYDVIPTGTYLFMIGDDGFYLYDYSNLQDIKALGHIPVEKV